MARKEAGHHLLFRWKREPNTGLVSFSHGKMHFGVALAEMAAQELKEKANLEGELQYRGDVYLRAYGQEEVATHQLIHIFTATLLGEAASNSVNGEAFWGDLADIPEVKVWPGTWEIADLLQEDPQGLFFREISVAL